ncbi:MAG: hypothetical protein L0J54_04195 [Halomonas sp.]|nr:hypothetical protein [Halomonas sp.]MDN6297215.1 hypothetical protein [Halomonas sp.]MDN6314716.1 hypothetical protein [Halomonas sp.]MDN6335837.1 hypothetical protein [Halomonas sp.]
MLKAEQKASSDDAYEHRTALAELRGEWQKRLDAAEQWKKVVQQQLALAEVATQGALERRETGSKAD